MGERPTRQPLQPEATGATMEATKWLLFTLDETMDIGLDTRTPVEESYKAPYRFTGTINKLTYKLGPSQLSPAEKKAAAQKVRLATD